MASATEQKALTNPSQLNPEGAFDAPEDSARGPAKQKPLRFGFLKVGFIIDISHFRLIWQDINPFNEIVLTMDAL